jgi:hypothetical protein
MTPKKQPLKTPGRNMSLLCLCGRPAFRLKCNAPVCKRCDDIERAGMAERKGFMLRRENVR